MIQLNLSLTNLPVVVQTVWEQFDPVHREALTQRLALVIAKAVAAPVITEEKSDDE
jgi:hypothetical protein